MTMRAFRGVPAAWLTLFGVAIFMISAPLAAMGASAKTVEISADSYSPKTISVAAGTKVIFKNTSVFPHTATADNGSFDTGTIAQGSSKSVTLKKSGTFAFHCQFHGAVGGVGQSGTITVTAASKPAAPADGLSGRPPASDTLPDLPGGPAALSIIAFAIAGIGSVLAAVVVDSVRGAARRRVGR